MGKAHLGPKSYIEGIKGSYVNLPSAPTINIVSEQPSIGTHQLIQEPLYIEKPIFVDRVVYVDRVVEVVKYKTVDVPTYIKVPHEVEKEVIKYADKIINIEVIKYVFPLWGKLLVSVPLVYHLIMKFL